MKELNKRNIQTKIYYPFPIHKMKAYHNLKSKKLDLPITEKISKGIFSLPLYPKMKDSDVNKISNTLINIVKKFK